MRLPAFLCVACALPACGTASTATSQISGTVSGQAFVSTSIVFALPSLDANQLNTVFPYQIPTDPNGHDSTLAVLASTSQDACADLQNDRWASTDAYVFLLMAAVNSKTYTPVVEGNFGVLTGDASLDEGEVGFAYGTFTRNNGSVLQKAVRGEVVVSQTGNATTEADGRVAITLDTATGDALSGLFTATWCDALATYVTAQTTP